MPITLPNDTCPGFNHQQAERLSAALAARLTLRDLIDEREAWQFKALHAPIQLPALEEIRRC